jgi:hypothetical protein
VPADRGEQVEKGHTLPPFSLRNFSGTSRRVQCVGHDILGHLFLEKETKIPLVKYSKCETAKIGFQV